MPAPMPMPRRASATFVGFNSAWGYWLSAFLGNVAYAVAIFSALSYFFPVFGDGNNLPSIIGASICLWLIHALVLKGIKQAAFVNVVTTIAKLVPIFLFVLVAHHRLQLGQVHASTSGVRAMRRAAAASARSSTR